MGFENFPQQIDNKKPQETLKFGYEEAAKFLSRNTMNINDPAFIRHYGAETVARDTAKARELREKFSQQDDLKKQEYFEQAKIMEASICVGIDGCQWFGPEVYAQATTDYDDIFNGVDVAAEIVNPDNSAAHLGLAIDATYSRDKLQEKAAMIRMEIDGSSKHHQANPGQVLSGLKYFKSDRLGFVGELSGLPRMIICCDAKKVKELSDYWQNNEVAGKMANDQVQYQFLEEILIQAQFFYDYAIKNNRVKEAGRLQTILKHINYIYDYKIIERNADGEPKLTSKIKRDDQGNPLKENKRPVLVKTRALADNNERDESFYDLIRVLQDWDKDIKINRPYEKYKQLIKEDAKDELNSYKKREAA